MANRVATFYDTTASVEAISNRRAEIARIQDQIATGKRVVEPKDDALAIANAERVRASLARIEIEKRTIGYARTVLGQAEGALADAGSTLQSARELLLSASNSTFTVDQRQQVAQQLRGMREQLLNIANRGDGVGNYLFGGQGASSEPFTGANFVSYQPQLGEREVGESMEFTLSLDGNQTFTQIPTPAGGVENIFDRLYGLAVVLEDPSVDPTSLTAAVKDGIAGIDAALNSASTRRTQVGEQLRQIDSHELSLASKDIAQRAYLSDLIDIDLAKAISDMSANQLALDASIKTYKSMADLSLFKYI